MISFSAFKTRKPRQFDYKPRYYDPEKERREERRKEVLGDRAEPKAGAEYKPGEYIRGNMKSRRGISERKRKKSSMTIAMGIAVLLALALAVWWVLN